MARRRRGPKPKPEPASSEVVLEFTRRISAAQHKAEEANAVLRQEFKRAKGAGIDLTPFKQAMADRKKDPDVLIAHQRAYARFAAIMGLPVYATQGDMLAADQDVQLTDKQKADKADWEAGEAGYAAGRSGQPRDANNNPPGSPAFVAWDTSWLKGQKAIAAELGENAKAVDVAPGSGGPRSRKPRNDDAEGAPERTVN